MKIIKTFFKLIHKPNKDSDIVTLIKKSHQHKLRSCRFSRFSIKVDSLTGEAAPGVLETVIEELKRLKDNGASRLLNLGGGVGQLSSIFRSIGYDVVNVDIAVENQDSDNIQADLNVVKDLPLDENSFDCVVCQEVIEHLENPWQLFRLVSKYLKSTGTFILTTPNIHSVISKKLFYTKECFRWFESKCISYHINPLPYWEIQLIASRNGFDIYGIRGNSDYYFAKKQNMTDFKKILKNNDVLLYFLKPCERSME